MKKILLTLAVMMAASVAWAQTDSISVTTAPGETHPAAVQPPPVGFMTAAGRGFFMDGAKISMAEAKDFVRPYPAASNHIRRAQGFTIASWVTAAAGGYLIGWGLATDINRNEPGRLYHRNDGNSTTGYYVGGAAMVAASLGLAVATVKQRKNAAAAYNAAVGHASSTTPRRPATLALTTARNGMGLRLTF